MSAVAPAQAAITTYNPFDANAGFTIVSTGDAHLSNSELEGSVAAFGSISSDNVNGYPVIHQAAGMADYTVPAVDGDPVRVLAGSFTGTGSFDLANRDDSGTISSSSPEANAIVKLADTSGLTAQTRGGGVGDNAGGDFPRVSNPAGGFLDIKALPYEEFAVSDIQTAEDSVAAYFPDLEAQVAQTNTCLSSMYGNPELSNEVTVANEGGLIYVSDFSTTMPNVIDYADVAGATIKMDRADGYVPTAEAPLVIRVPAGTTSIERINFEGWSSASGAEQDYSRYIMLDMSMVTGTVTVDGLEMGALWAPEATIAFTSGVTTNGQWMTAGVTTSGGGEIHHHTFQGQLLCDLAAPTPEIATSVAVDGTDDKVLPVTGGTVTDTVSYSGLTVGTEYVVSGTVVTSDGSSTGVTGSTTFTPADASGTVEVVFTFTAEQAEEFAGQSLVVFEELTLDGEVVAEHEDLTDEAQTFTVAETVLVPEIATSVAVDGTDDKILPVTGGTVVDTVSYSGLTAGTEYVVSGTVVTSDGSSTGVTGSTTFTPTDASGTVEVVFTFTAEQAEEFAGQSLVVFEELTLDGEVVAEHEDLTDEAQTFTVAETVLIPEIATSVAVDGTDDKVLPVTGGTVTDTVSYSGLMVGTEYVVSGTLMTADGTSTGITASETFTPTSSSGTVEVVFTLSADDAEAYAGQSLVVFEELMLDGEVVAEHADLTDEAQTFTVAETVLVPEIATSVAVDGTDDKVLPVTGGTVTDTVSYSGLTAGAEYVVSGTVVTSDGSSTGVTGSTTFTPTDASGTVEVVFTFTAEQAEEFAGQSLVVFEELTLDGEVVAEHADLTDEAQTFTVAETVLVPEIATSVAVDGTDDKVLPISGGTVVDTVSYSGLTAGTEYALSGTVVTEDGTSTGVTGGTTFTPTETSGTIDVTFLFTPEQAEAYAGQRLVVFEELTLDGEVVAEHADLTDEAQMFEVAERVTPTPTPTPTPSPSVTPSPTPSATPTPSPSPSDGGTGGTPSPSPSPSDGGTGGTPSPSPSEPGTSVGGGKLPVTGAPLAILAVIAAAVAASGVLLVAYRHRKAV